MDWFFNWFRKNMSSAAMRNECPPPMGGGLTTSNRSTTAANGLKRVEILTAVNGILLEVAYRKQIHSDWEVTLYIVKDDEALADAIATALVVTGEH